MTGHPLVAHGLCKTFPAFRLAEVGFRVEPGKILGFLGGNGAGKSTTLRLTMGLLRKEAGTATWGPWDHQRHEKDFKTEVAFVDEESHFYADMTVAALIRFASRFFPRWDHRRADELLDRLALDPRVSAGRLSKGSRTKLALLVALARRPAILLLDEPSAGLDPLARSETFLLLQECRAAGLGILFSTHILEELEPLADHIILLHEGRVLSDEAVSVLRQADSEAGWLNRMFHQRVKARRSGRVVSG